MKGLWTEWYTISIGFNFTIYFCRLHVKFSGKVIWLFGSINNPGILMFALCSIWVGLTLIFSLIAALNPSKTIGNSRDQFTLLCCIYCTLLCHQSCCQDSMLSFYKTVWLLRQSWYEASDPYVVRLQLLLRNCFCFWSSRCSINNSDIVVPLNENAGSQFVVSRYFNLLTCN